MEKQRRLGAVGLSVALVITLVLALERPLVGGVSVWVWGLAFGLVLQKSRFCFVASFRDPMVTGSTAVSRAVILLLALNTLGFSAVQLWLGPVGDVYPAGWHTLVGGILFGVGMVVAGGCASGTLMRVGEGHLLQWFTLFGFIVGSLAGAMGYGWWQAASMVRSPELFLPDYWGWPAAVAAQLGLLGLIYYGLIWYEGKALGVDSGSDTEDAISGGDADAKSDSRLGSALEVSTGARAWLWREAMAKLYQALVVPWPYWAGAVALAVLNTGFLALHHYSWGITTAFTYWGAWLGQILGAHPEQWYFFTLPGPSTGLAAGFGHDPRTLLDLGMIAGAFLSAALASEWRWRRPRMGRQVLAALAGGVAMGYGSRIAFGCNIGAFLNGVSSLSLHGWLFGLALVAGAWIGSQILLRYLVR